jgi:hypothetical protein
LNSAQDLMGGKMVSSFFSFYDPELTHSRGNQDLDQEDRTPGETWTPTTNPQARVIPLLSSTTNPLPRSTTPTTPLLSSNTTPTKPLLLNSTKVVTIRTRTKGTANNKTTVVLLLNSMVETSTITVRRDSTSRVLPRGNGIIKETSITNNITINPLRIMEVGDLLVDTGVRDDFDDLIYMIDEMRYTCARKEFGIV